MNFLRNILKEVRPVNQSRRSEIQQKLDALTKPQGSLGRLEDIAMQICMLQNTLSPSVGEKMIFTFAADHGVSEENVSAFPKAVTAQMVINMLNGGAAINVLAQQAGIDLKLVDMGVDHQFEPHKNLIVRKLNHGTHNMAQGPAMTIDQAEDAVDIGIHLAINAADQGVSLLGTGDMGIGNTTAASALMAALLPCHPKEITGLGTGIKPDVLSHKVRIIEKAIEKNSFSNPLEALAALGGFEIAGICGLIIGGASRRIPVVVDGFISSAAALVACRMSPLIKDYLFFSHLSAESGHALFLKEFNVKPLLDLKMRLGEGTGAALAIPIVESAVRILNEMATFESAQVANKETV